VSAVFSGIVGNRADAGFVHFWEWAKADRSITFRVWPSIFFTSTILVIIIIAIYFFRIQFNLKIKELKKALNISTKLNELDASILLLLSRLKQNSNRTSATNQLLYELLSKIRETVPGVTSIWLCLPDEKDENYLKVCHADPAIASEIKEKVKFYVGEPVPGIKRGLAGSAYVNWRMQVTSFSVNKVGTREPTNPEYIIFGNANATSHTTTAAVVIIDDDNKRLGVMCVDSFKPDIFESTQMKDLLKEISRRLARILVVSKP
jgi:hypothetical protein